MSSGKVHTELWVPCLSKADHRCSLVIQPVSHEKEIAYGDISLVSFGFYFTFTYLNVSLISVQMFVEKEIFKD